MNVDYGDDDECRLDKVVRFLLVRLMNVDIVKDIDSSLST